MKPSIQESEMNREQDEIEKLFRQARIIYPIGTKFLSTYEGDEAIVGDHDFEWIPGSKAVQNSDGGWVYSNREWAKIVSLSELVINNYNIY